MHYENRKKNALSIWELFSGITTPKLQVSRYFRSHLLEPKKSKTIKGIFEKQVKTVERSPFLAGPSRDSGAISVPVFFPELRSSDLLKSLKSF